jgi:nucleotide-binding universal stress UspA family protein
VYVIDTINLNVGVDFPFSSEVSGDLAKTGQDILDKAGAVACEAGVSAETALIKIDTLGQRIPQMIVADAEAWPADLIVIGTHGRRGLSHLFLGSVAEGVARVATKPVLLFRGK